MEIVVGSAKSFFFVHFGEIVYRVIGWISAQDSTAKPNANGSQWAKSFKKKKKKKKKKMLMITKIMSLACAWKQRERERDKGTIEINQLREREREREDAPVVSRHFAVAPGDAKNRLRELVRERGSLCSSKRASICIKTTRSKLMQFRCRGANASRDWWAADRSANGAGPRATPRNQSAAPDLVPRPDPECGGFF